MGNKRDPVEVKSKWEADGLETRRLKVQGLKIDVVTSNFPVAKEPEISNDKAVILVHGLGVSSGYMRPTARLIAPFYKVYVPDLPGFGKSEKPSKVLNISELADFLVAFLKVAGLEKAYFLANSMGCQVVVDLAVRYPGLVEKAVLTGPTMDPLHRSAITEIFRLLRDSLGEPPRQIRFALADYFRCGPARMWQTMKYALQDSIETKLPAVALPVLVVRGSRDSIAPMRWCEEMVRLLPEGQVAVIEGAPHAVCNRGASELAAISLSFFKKSNFSARLEK